MVKTEKKLKMNYCCEPGSPVGISREIKEGFFKLGLKINF